MAPPKTVHGARALVYIAGVNGGKPVGIFNSVSYSLTYDVQPINVLGRYSPVELVTTAQEAVPITCTGWRVMDFGPHEAGALPRLQDLLNEEYIELAILDRQTGKRIAAFHQCRGTGMSGGISNRNASEVTVNYLGITMDDEGAETDDKKAASETPGAITSLQ